MTEHPSLAIGEHVHCTAVLARGECTRGGQPPNAIVTATSTIPSTTIAKAVSHFR